MHKPDVSWGFTDIPNWHRICRELKQAGCSLGLVTAKGPITHNQQTFTLVDSGVYLSFSYSEAVYVVDGYYKFIGNKINELLDIVPHEVHGYYRPVTVSVAKPISTVPAPPHKDTPPEALRKQAKAWRDKGSAALSRADSLEKAARHLLGEDEMPF